jgi:hypothetical protein
LLDKFPRGEAALRGIQDVKWEDSLFATRTDGNTTRITVPKNWESFADSRVALAITAVIDGENWKMVASSQTLPVNVLKSQFGDWLIGYVNAHLERGGSVAELGSSKYCKGYHAYQSGAVRAHYSSRKLDHLKLSSITPGHILAKMDSFTKEHWGLRSVLSAIFKRIEPRGQYPAIDLSSFLKSHEELLAKKLRKRQPYENGGVFTPNEKAWLKLRLATSISHIQTGRERLLTRDAALAANFESELTEYRVAVSEVDAVCKPIIALRSDALFSQKKTKAVRSWMEKPLQDKLLAVDAKHLGKFSPVHLSPMVTSTPEEVPEGDLSRDDLLRLYGVAGEPPDELISVLQDYIALLASRE